MTAKNTRIENDFDITDLVFKISERGVGTYMEIMEKWTIDDVFDYIDYLRRNKR